MSFGRKVRYLRQQNHWTQQHLATQLGLTSHVHISYLERGERLPSLEITHQIACLFAVSLEYLFRDDLAVESVQQWNHTDTGKAMHEFGQKLRTLRKQHGFTQTHVAHHLGLKTHTHISELETHEKEPSIVLLLAIADLFGCSIDMLVRDSMTLS